jgi:hypothetical protein
MGVVMHANFAGTDRQPQATPRNRSAQRELSIHAAAPPPPPVQMLPPAVVAAATFSQVLQFSAQHSGLDDEELADRMCICKGYMSRFMRGVAQQWARRLVVFMRETHSLAPLQWMAEQSGCELVARDSRAAEVAALRARLHALEHAA